MNRTLLALTLFCSTVVSRPMSSPAFSDNQMGSYEGFWTTTNGNKGRASAQIRWLNANQYDGFVLLHRHKLLVTALKLNPAMAQDGRVHFSGTTSPQASRGDLLAGIEAQGELTSGKFTGTFTGDLGAGAFELSKTEPSSRRVGAKAPKHALVPFDGKDVAGWKDFHWKISNDGSMEVTQGDLEAVQQLKNFKLHLEFRIPLVPTENGRVRGKSGVLLQGQYKVSVQDSFGVYPLGQDDCGAVSGIRPPFVNACFPPTEWQALDITFTSRDAAQQKPAIVTVLQNGILIVDRAFLPEANPDSRSDALGFLKLQEFGSPVQYRNIWAEAFFSKSKVR